MAALIQLAIYNPGLLSDADFLAAFVARQGTVEQLVKRLREVKPKSLAKHRLILGQRGMGKTSLLRRLALAISEDSELSERLLPLTFREEQYNVQNLHTFWCNCLDALADHFEKQGEHDKADAVDKQLAGLASQSAPAKKYDDGEAALTVLKTFSKAEGKRLILLIDNIDLILDGLKKQDLVLRRTLQEAGGIVVYGASAAYMEAVTNPKAAFYDFFQVTTLKKLGAEELMTCLRQLAQQRGDVGRPVVELLNRDPGRIRALYDLTGGNPRTLVLLYTLLEAETGEDTMSDLERLLDEVTVLYKARVEDLAPQARVVLDAVALHWDPIAAAKIADITGMATSAVSAQVDRLLKAGILEKTSTSKSNRNAFQLGERFFNIWYLMRHAPRRQRARLRWLTGFLRGFYSPIQLRDKASSLLRRNGGNVSGHYMLALSDAVDDSALRHLLGQDALRHLEELATRQGKRLEDIIDPKELPTPNSADEWFGMGWWLHTQLRRYDEAEQAYLKCIQLNPKSSYPWNNLGSLLQDHLGRYEESEAAYLTAIELNPINATTWNDLGSLLQDHLGRYEDSETAYRTAIELDPINATPWNDLGSLLQDHLGRYEDAEVAYRTAAKLDLKYVPLWKNLGNLLQDHLGRYEEAETAYRTAIELDPKYAAPWNDLGSLLSDTLGRYEEAETAYRTAIELDPKNATPWNDLGSLLQEHLGRYEESETAYRTAIEIDSKYAPPRNNLGNLLRDHLGHPAEAEQAYRQALGIQPTYISAHVNLAYLLLGTGSDAQPHLEQALNGLPSHGAALLRAFVAFTDDNFGAATAALTCAMETEHAELFSLYFDDLLRNLRMAKTRGYGDKLLVWLDDSGLAEQYWPLRTAFEAYLHGEDKLKDVNPEVRGAAERIYRSLMG